MPDTQQPSLNDSWTDLWRKADRNFFAMAQALGYNEWLEPNALDNQNDAMRKAVLYSAFVASNL
jgi:hypothetical protein